MKYIFTQSANALVVTTDTESGRFPAEIKTYTGASADLANDRIYLREYGMDKQNFSFFEISTIDGVAPTDLEDAFDKLLVLIANFNGGGTAPSYKVYTALLRQSGTDAPIATVLENTLGGDILWSYVGVGKYIGTLTGAFTNNTFCFINATIDSSSDTIRGIIKTSSNTVLVSSSGMSSNEYLNDLFFNEPIEIRVYN